MFCHEHTFFSTLKAFSEQDAFSLGNLTLQANFQKQFLKFSRGRQTSLRVLVIGSPCIKQSRF